MINASLFLPSEQIPEGEHLFQFNGLEKTDYSYIAIFVSEQYGTAKYYFSSPNDANPIGGMSLEESVALKQRSNLSAVTELAVAILGKKEMFSYKAPSYDAYFEGLMEKLNPHIGRQVYITFTSYNNKSYIAKKKWIRPLEQ